MTKEHLQIVYRALLAHPHGGWRTQNQEVYCIVRDALAVAENASIQDTQEKYENELLTD